MPVTTMPVTTMPVTTMPVTTMPEMGWLLSFLVIAGSQAAAVHAASPPPEPDVAPIISTVRAEDDDGDGIEDQLLGRLRAAEDQLDKAVTETEVATARRWLEAVVPVELVFSRQVTQPEIDTFLAAGGEITYLYRAVSYGWHGSLRLGDVETVAADLAGLVYMAEDKPVRPHLDEATRTGRVRPIWAAGFAGVPAGIDGDSSITIAILDSGVDTTHPDLIGREAGWIDHVPIDSEPTAVDYRQHGTLAAAVAVGSGDAFGVGPGTFEWTESGLMFEPPCLIDDFCPSPVHIVGSTTLTSTAVFIDGGSTELHGASAPDTGGWTNFPVSASGGSPLGPVVNTFVGTAGERYSPRLNQNDADPISYYAVFSSLTNVPAAGDGFQAFRGVCPQCRWYGEKILPNIGGGFFVHMDLALDHIVTQRIVSGIKIANISVGGIGDPGLSSVSRDKTNTAVANGIFIAASAGNDGAGIDGANVIDDPARAGMAMTVGATNDVNQLTDYTSSGFTTPAANEDYKPDVLAPGGSIAHYSGILSADSNTWDGDSSASTIPDQQADDYGNGQGTSLAAPFVAGAAGLVIDAMQQAGTTWDFSSSDHPLFVKMILSATATETNAPRESAGFDPELNRDAVGTGDSIGWPAGKDRFEGYGLINPDAAVEAVLLSYTGVAEAGTFDGTVNGRRAWARNISLIGGTPVDLYLDVPSSGDFDLYLFSEIPDANGNPVVLASSTTAGNGDGRGAADETISFTPLTSERGYLVIRRVSGSGAFTITGEVVLPLIFSDGFETGDCSRWSSCPI